MRTTIAAGGILIALLATGCESAAKADTPAPATPAAVHDARCQQLVRVLKRLGNDTTIAQGDRYQMTFNFRSEYVGLECTNQ